MSDGVPAAFLAAFPASLRALIDAELAAGNTIVEHGSSFPAPPAGGYILLARLVSTRPREDAADVRFYERDTPQYSGEWHDERRFWFVLEPPLPPPAAPDMDAIRRAAGTPAAPVPHAPPGPTGEPANERWLRRPSSLVDRFAASMSIDYGKWRDGIGYDVGLIEHADDSERAAIEATLAGRGVRDWRDVEALAALGTPRALAVLRAVAAGENAELRGAVLRYAPALFDDIARTDHIVHALRTAVFFGGLTQALDEAAGHHPPAVIHELFRGALHREGEVAPSFAALLLHLFGVAETRYAWDERPFVLRFNTADPAARATAFRELCARVGVEPPL
jgi:hypothetical protein